MKIVFIIATLPTGGAQMMLLKLLERLDRRFAPHVISLSTLGDVGPRIQALGVPIEAIGMKPGFPSPPGFLRLVKRLKNLAPDIVHTWMYHADLLGGLAARLAGTGSVIWSIRHGNLDSDKNKHSTLAVVQACALLSEWLPARILSNSEQACRVHIARGYDERRMQVIPNGFDLSKFKPDAAAKTSVRRELEIPLESPVVGLIGRYHAQKNIEGFLEAASQLRSRIRNVYFLLAGEGLDSSNQAIARAMEHGDLGPAARLLGIRTDIPRLMASLDVLALSSSGEAFPNVLGEAMACGVPCAVTDAGDSAFIVGDTGRVVRAGDMLALAAALENLLSLSEDARVQLGARARERIADHFEIGKIVRRYEMLYDELRGSVCAE